VPAAAKNCRGSQGSHFSLSLALINETKKNSLFFSLATKKSKVPYFVGRILDSPDKIQSKLKFFKYIRIADHTLKWLNVDDIYTGNNEQVFAGPLQLTGSGPFQIAFGDAIPLAYMQHSEKRRLCDLVHNIKLLIINQFCYTKCYILETIFLEKQRNKDIHVDYTKFLPHLYPEYFNTCQIYQVPPTGIPQVFRQVSNWVLKCVENK
jgi:hypothetical protein